MPMKISWCVNLLGSQLFSKGSSEFFPTNHEDQWAFDYCWSSKKYKGPLKDHFFYDTLLSVFLCCLSTCTGSGLTYVQICRNPSSWRSLSCFISRKLLNLQLNIIAGDKKSCRKENLYRSPEAEQGVNGPKTSETWEHQRESLLLSTLWGAGALNSYKSYGFYTHTCNLHTCKCLLYILLTEYKS